MSGWCEAEPNNDYVAHFKPSHSPATYCSLSASPKLPASYAMGAASISSPSLAAPISNNNNANYSKSTSTFPCCSRRSCNKLIANQKLVAVPPISAINDVSSAADPARAQVTWQIIVGAIAGVAPFVVAGIEFSKRIIAQRRCGVCGGSGLVLREKDYFKCPECGGFLPWQSWKRFFTG